MEAGISEMILNVLNLDQSKICICLNCEKEFFAKNDFYACSIECRNELEIIKIKHIPIASDQEIKEFMLYNKVSQYYINN